MNAHPRIQKNLHIYLPDTGLYRPIHQLMGETDPTILALNSESWRLEERPVEAIRVLGTRPAYWLETRLGRQLLAAGGYAVLTIAGWRRVEELTPGVCIAVPRRLPGPEESTLQKKELELIACFLAERWTLAGGRVSYSTGGAEQAEVVAHLARRVFGRATRAQARETQMGWVVELTADEKVIAWLEHIGLLWRDPSEWCIPEPVFAQPVRGIGHFLRQLWSSGGTIAIRRGHAPLVCYSTPSAALARGIQSLLLRLGINAVITRPDGQHLRPARPSATPAAGRYGVHISGTADLKRFSRVVRELGKQQERSMLAILEYLAGHSGITSRDLLPRETWALVVEPAMRSAGVTEQQIQAVLGYPPFTGLIRMSRERAAQVARLIRCDPLAKLAQSDLYWDDIIAVEQIGEAPAYELTVAGLRGIIADDMLVSVQNEPAIEEISSLDDHGRW